MLDLGKTIRSLLELEGHGAREMPLVPSSPHDCPQLRTLRNMSTQDLFGKRSVVSRSDARCVHAGLYLYFSALDESHSISQSIHTASGSYWHGIMHRQEGDWGNAKYWFRRTGRHSVFEDLEEALGEPWDPFEFVDRCAAESAAGGRGRDLIQCQMMEWQLLMEHCFTLAVGE